MNKKKIIKICILLTIIVIIVALTLLLLINLKKDSVNINNDEENNKIIEEDLNDYNIYNQDEIGDSEVSEELQNKEYDKKLSNANNIKNYNIVYSILTKYLNCAANMDTNIINLLSNNYINTNGINNNNVYSKIEFEKIQNMQQYYKIAINNVLMTQISDTTNVYIVDYFYRVKGNEESNHTSLMVELNTQDKIYMIYPNDYLIKNEINNLKENDILNYNEEEIKNNEYNQINYILDTDLEKCTFYFDNFLELIKCSPENAYKKLNNEYSSKRFENYSEFQEYLIDNKARLALIYINEYKTTQNGGETNYICSDQYGNIYTFIDNGLTYSVFLDNYTVKNKEDIVYYNDLSTEEKERYCIILLRDMVNTKDYKAIYNRLNITFKNNNFSNINEFKKFIEENSFGIIKTKVIEMSNGNDYSIYKCKISNALNDKETKDAIICIKLLDNNEFEMSINFNT